MKLINIFLVKNYNVLRQDFSKNFLENCFLWSRHGAGTGTGKKAYYVKGKVFSKHFFEQFDFYGLDMEPEPEP